MICRRTLLGATAAILIGARPAAAQQADLPRIALVEQGRPVEQMTEGGAPVWDALLRELAGLNHVDGQTISIERWSGAGIEGNDAFRNLIQAIVETGPDLVVAGGVRAVLALKEATSTIPIVGVGSFPGFNLARPGGNVTGVDTSAGTDIYVKQLQLLHDVVPEAAEIVWLGPLDSWAGPVGMAARHAAEQLQVALQPVIVDEPVSEGTIRRAFVSVAQVELPLFVSSASAMNPFAAVVAELALAARVPAIGLRRELADAGLLMALGPDFPELFRRAAGYVDRILKGADPAEMAIEQPTTFEFVLNLRTATALGITVPPSILLQATEIVE